MVHTEFEVQITGERGNGKVANVTLVKSGEWKIRDAARLSMSEGYVVLNAAGSGFAARTWDGEKQDFEIIQFREAVIWIMTFAG